MVKTTFYNKQETETSKQSAHTTFLKDTSIKNKESSVFIPQAELDLFHYMVDHIGDEVMVVHKDSRIVFVNDAALKGLGRTKREVLNVSFTKFLKEEMSVQQWEKKYFLVLKKEKRSISYVFNRIGKKGRVCTIDVTAVYMKYKEEDYILLVGRDISDKLVFENKLRKSQERYRLISEQAAEGILMMGHKGVILYANKSAGKIVKMPHKKLLGTQFQNYVAKTSREKARKYFHKVRIRGSVVNGELDVVDKKGKVVPVEFAASPILENGEVAQVHIIVRDMSRRKELEALLRETEKMEALQDFVAGTAHEIQQPLKALVDRSQNLIDDYKNRDFEYIGYKEFKNIIDTLRLMNDQVHYCFNTIDRLLSLKKPKVKLEENRCDVNKSVGQAIKMLKHSLRVSGIKVELRLRSRLPQAAINVLDLNQVIANVVTNAVQSIPSGNGVINIKTSYQKAENTIRIDCQDDGVGIPKEVLSRVFEPFFTTKSRGLEKSAGLGLSIVYSIVKSYHGEVVIKSNSRQGTLVTITLPVSQ